MSEILNYYKKRKIETHLLTDRYFDVVISREGNCKSVSNYKDVLSEECLSSYIDFENSDCISGDSITSLREWANAKAEGITLNDVGFTFIDNGHIWFNKYLDDKKDILNKIFNSEYEINAEDKSLKMYPVSGITQALSYPYKIIPNEYLELRGGFYQGFFKLHEKNYEMLPSNIEDEWNLEFVIRPKDYKIEADTLNHIYPENKGIFFYMGTRAENKFAQFYDGAFSDYLIDVGNDKFCPEFNDKIYGELQPLIKELSQNNIYNPSLPFIDCNCECIKHESKNSGETTFDKCGYYFEDEYLEKEKEDTISSDVTKDGKPLYENGYFEINTDNKHLFFSRAKGDFTTENWKDANIVLTGITKNYNTNLENNLFLNMHHGKGGLTTESISKLESSATGKKYSLKNDIVGNAFALKYNDDGSIGYRYLISDCDLDEQFKIIEETSFSGLVQEDRWNTIMVKIKSLNGFVDDCGNSSNNRKMKLFIYVNGYLKFISKELPIFNFHALDETEDKQEGVPYNISLGGGTQGLKESVWVKYWEKFPYQLPLERNFAGSFIGDIRSFKFYTCAMDYAHIRNNALFEQNKTKML